MNIKRVQHIVKQAIREGKLKKPKYCEICWRNPKENQTQEWHTGLRHKTLVAHHWHGYDYPLDVWWICHSCNRMLVGRHDGSLKNTMEAFYYISWWIDDEDIPDTYKHIRELYHRWILNQSEQEKNSLHIL